MIIRIGAWLAVIWIVATIVFPEVTAAIPTPVLVMSYVLAGALIINANEYLLSFGFWLGAVILTPIGYLVDFIVSVIKELLDID